MTHEHMQRALDLARNAPEATSPNPTVGAVVVAADGTVVGEGWTQPPPGPHAEAVALKAAGDRARGSEVYTTLEPCNHAGRTGPCSQAIIAAGVAEVHYATDDPNPVAAGGRQALEAAGIRVVSGDGEAEARRINEAFFKHKETGLPFIIAKFAASLDGRIAAASGDSRWVSGPETRGWAHRFRTRIDAILVGSSTVVVDDPELTARPDGVDKPRQPLRVVVDTRGRIPPMARVFTGPSKTLVATAEDAPAEWRASIEATGAEVMSFPLYRDRVDVRALAAELGKRDVQTLLVEGGGVILGAFFDARLVDKVHAIIAPMIVGAVDAPMAVAGEGAARMAGALRLRETTVERLGDDILVVGYPTYPEIVE